MLAGDIASDPPSVIQQGQWLKDAVAVAMLAIGVLAVFYPVALHPGDLIACPRGLGTESDLVTHFIPRWAFVRQRLKVDGRIPMWNPFDCLGMPHLGTPQCTMFYPANWLFFFRESRLVTWSIIGHHWWMATGTYFLCRRFGIGRLAAWTGGIVTGGATPLVAHSAFGHYEPLCAASWAPWALLAYEKLRSGESCAIAILAAITGMSGVAGHLQETYYLALLLAGLLLSDVGKRLANRDARNAVRLLLGGLLAAALGAGLAAVAILPGAAFFPESIRAKQVQVVSADFELVNLSQLMNPYALGWGNEYFRPSTVFWETLLHVGVTPLLLSLLATVLARRREPTLRYASAGFLLINIAFGRGNLVYRLCGALPGFSSLRFPTRTMYIVVVPVGVLTAIAIDEWGNRAKFAPRTLRRYFGFSIVIALAIPFISALGLMNANMIEGMSLLGSPAHWIGLLVSVLALGWSITAHCNVRALILVVAALCLVEEIVPAQKNIHMIPWAGLRHENVLLDAVAATSGTEAGRIWSSQALATDRETWSRGMASFRGYEPFLSARYVQYCVALTRGDASAALNVLDSTRPDRLLPNLTDLAGIRHALLQMGPTGGGELAGWRLIGTGAIPPPILESERPELLLSAAVWENPAVMPRAFVLGNVVTVPPPDEFKQTVEALTTLQPRQWLLLEQDVLPPGPRQVYSPATIVESFPDRIVVNATLTLPGYLHLSDLFASGWTAEVDGMPTKILPANLAFRAVPLSPGNHRVEFCYFPPRLKFAAATSVLCLATIVILLARRGWRLSSGAKVGLSTAPR